MASRRAATEESSLDLLLDTITNAFGGILFLAILVVILLRTTNKNVETLQTQTPNTPELAAKLQQTRSEQAALELELKAVDSVSSNLANPALRSTLTTLEEQKKRRDELIAERVRISQGVAIAQQQHRTVTQRNDALTSELQSQSAAVALLRQGLESEKASRQVSSSFPEERPASKQSFSVSIRYGRLYYDRSSSGALNLDDFTVLDSDGEYLTVTPKPYAGTAIMDNGKLSTALIDDLVKKNPSTEYIEISIWDDSYEGFQLLRDYLVTNGFEYRLIAVTDGDEVVETIVPNPLVQ